MKKVGMIWLFLISILLMPFTVYGEEMPFLHYNYSPDKKIFTGPSGYEVEKVFYGDDFGTGNFKNPRDIFVDKKNDIYVADTGNNRIVRLDTIRKTATEYINFKFAGKGEKLKEPQGIFVDGNGTIYIADTGNERLIIAGQNCEIKQIIVKPNTTLFKSSSKFKPQKVVVDPAGRIYVKAEGVYEGIMEYNENGEFMSYFGSNPVAPSLTDLLWRKILTKEQIKRTQKFISIEYANIDIDEEGFIYTTVFNQKTGNIKKLNPSGKNIMPSLVYFANTYGDIDMPSKLTDINCRGGYITALDYSKGRLFEYDTQGNLLFAFGSPGDIQGTFTGAVALDNIGDSLLVLDNVKNNITVFRRTEFGNLVKSAVDLYSKALYEEAVQPWNEVLKRNANYDLAYVGIGKAYYKTGRYREAMDYFKLGSYKKGYSDAFKLYRQDFIRKNFKWFVLGIIAIIFLSWGLPRIIRKRRQIETDSSSRYGIFDREKLRYAFRLLSHPFDTLWYIKYRDRGSLQLSMIILGLFWLTILFKMQFTGYIFNTRRPEDLRLIYESGKIFVPFIMLITSNWMVSTLLDGEGKYPQIWIVTSYSLIPVILTFIPTTILSNFLIDTEGIFLKQADNIAIIWSGLLVFFGIKYANDFTMKKNVFISVLTLLGMGVMIFLGALFITLIQETGSFIYSIINEIYVRS